MVKHLLLQHSSLLFIVVLSILFQFLLEHTNILLRYQRELFLGTFLTQCITPSLVHINWTHWLFNILNLMALVILFPKILDAKQLLILFVFSSVCIMLLLYFFSPHVVYYAGMSGVLYSLAVYASLSSLIAKRKVILSTFVLLYVLLKLLAHDWINALMGVDKALQGMQVITDVHWYGTAFGVGYFLVSHIRLALFKSS